MQSNVNPERLGNPLRKSSDKYHAVNKQKGDKWNKPKRGFKESREFWQITN